MHQPPWRRKGSAVSAARMEATPSVPDYAGGARVGQISKAACKLLAAGAETTACATRSGAVGAGTPSVVVTDRWRKRHTSQSV